MTYIRTKEFREKISKKYRKEGNPFFGRHHTIETRKRISQKLKGRMPKNSIAGRFRGRHHSLESKKKVSENSWMKKNKGKKILWKKGRVGYGAIHDWLRRTFGEANKCENPECSKKSKVFEWAKLNNRQHERKRDNYWMLCKTCHNKYDQRI